MVDVAINRLFVGKSNVRREIGDITELVASVKEKGILYPIVVRPVSKRFEIIVGSRRFAAARKLGLKKIPALVRPLRDTEAMVESLVENVQRGDLELEEEGNAYEFLIKKLGGAREVSRQIGVSPARITETLQALEAARKLSRAGITVGVRSPNTSLDRASKNALPKQHAVELERAFRSETVQKLPEGVRRSKYVEAARAIAPLSQDDARKLLNELKMYPEKDIRELEAKAARRISGVALQTYLPPKMARELDAIARERKVSLEEVLPEVVRRGLSGPSVNDMSKSNEKDEIVISEIDTGYQFSCPVCKGRYRIIHNKPTNVHKFEQVE